MKYRSSLLLIESVLDNVQEPKKITHVIQKTNISHARLEAALDKLIGSGLVNQIEYDGYKAFVVTDKGRMYLEEYKRFNDLALSFGLEL